MQKANRSNRLKEKVPQIKLIQIKSRNLANHAQSSLTNQVGPSKFNTFFIPDKVDLIELIRSSLLDLVYQIKWIGFLESDQGN